MAIKSRQQKKFFKDFLTRLEERDKKMEQSDLEVSNTSLAVSDPGLTLLLRYRPHRKILCATCSTKKQEK
jgi:hypothetical protein